MKFKVSSEVRHSIPSRPAKYSLHSVPIQKNFSRLHGNSREAGDAPYEVKDQVGELIIQASSHLSRTDQAILLAIAHFESGMNPDAANRSSSAAGVFQIVRDTARKLGLLNEEVFDARKNIAASIRLYEENKEIVTRRWPRVKGAEFVALMYAHHHDGPSLDSGGLALGRRKVVPLYSAYAAELSGR
jgi:hypothetical protein